MSDIIPKDRREWFIQELEQFLERNFAHMDFWSLSREWKLKYIRQRAELLIQDIERGILLDRQDQNKVKEQEFQSLWDTYQEITKEYRRKYLKSKYRRMRFYHFRRKFEVYSCGEID